MTPGREFEGKDLRQALGEAARALGIPEPELDFEILEQGRRGLFGLGAQRVRIRIKPPVEMPALEGTAAEISVATGPAREGAEPRAESRAVADTVRRIFDLMGLRLTAEAVDADGGTRVEVRGADVKLLKRKDRELLHALQFLLNRMARRAWPEAGRIQLSCDGGRQRRDEDLVQLVREVAQQVERTGKAKRLQPMNAYERRLVHLTVQKFAGVGSRSEGQAPLKRVRIYPETRDGDA